MGFGFGYVYIGMARIETKGKASAYLGDTVEVSNRMMTSGIYTPALMLNGTCIVDSIGKYPEGLGFLCRVGYSIHLRNPVS